MLLLKIILYIKSQDKEKESEIVNGSNVYIIQIPISGNNMNVSTKTIKILQKETIQKMVFTILLITTIFTTTIITPSISFIHAFAQSPNQFCTNAVFSPPLPQSFSNRTSIPFNVDFGIAFRSISGIVAVSTYDINDAFGNGDKYFIDNYGGQETQTDPPEITTMSLNSIDPSVLIQFIDGTYQGKYVDNEGNFTLTSLKFCIMGEPLHQGVCPAKDVEHWDKIVFMITSPDITKKLNLTANTELDIKVLDNPYKVADIKQKVIEFLNAPNDYKNSIKVLAVDYAIICDPHYKFNIHMGCLSWTTDFLS